MSPKQFPEKILSRQPTFMTGFKTALQAFLLTVVTFVASFPQQAHSHSVGQVQMSKYLAQETVDLLIARAEAGNPGLKAGDIAHFIIEFTPIANNATVGAGGYVTDYIPANTQVVDAAIITLDGNDNVINIPPGLPGTMPDGWGNRGQQTYTGVFTGRSNGRLTDIYGDTGIFYSTDSRTAGFTAPDTDGVIRQSTNGYHVNPSAEGQLNPLLNQTDATTHNLWDANNTNVFGTKDGDEKDLASPSSTLTPVIGRGGGATPFNAGSAVAGPDSGYQQDYTGQVGPWQRISYQGSRRSCAPICLPALDANGGGEQSISGVSTTAGASFPLPSNTNAVRWAVGRLDVGDIYRVSISLKLLSDASSTGLLNNSEVFGGDSAQTDLKRGQDNAWRYHVPSVARANTALTALKKVVRSNGTNSDGAQVPAGEDVTLTYRITFVNTSDLIQNNIRIRDTLPSQVKGSPFNFNIISGPNLLPITPSNPSAGDAFEFAGQATLAAGGGGVIEYDVIVNADALESISNKLEVWSDEVPVPSVSYSVSIATNTAKLAISKTASTDFIAPGVPMSYTITIENTGSVAASDITVFDILPSDGGTNTDDRFSYVNNSSTYTGLTGPANPTIVNAPTEQPYTSEKRDQLSWVLGGSLAAGASATVTFNAVPGAAVDERWEPYLNYVKASYKNGSTTTNTPWRETAGIIVGKPLHVLAKTVEVISDPANGTNNPKAIPGAVLRYTLTLSNAGIGRADADSVILLDRVPDNTALLTQSIDGADSGPMRFKDGVPSSELSYQFLGLPSQSDDLGFSNNEGSTYDYSPIIDANGSDPAVTHFKVAPKGIFSSAETGNPSFQLQFDVRVD